MIYDKIESMGRYTADEAMKEGLALLQRLYAEALQGHYPTPGRIELSHGGHVNIDRYTTKRVNPASYEAHQRYIDIQMLLAGRECIRVHDIEDLAVTTPYDTDRDVTFLTPSEGDTHCTELLLGDGHFAVLYPNEAHEPQLCVAAPEEVIKMVAKIPLSR